MHKFLIKFSSIILSIGMIHASAAAAADVGKGASAAGAVGDMALYQGADREARLIEGAKKEGDLSIYYVYQNMPIIMAAFTKKYGIKVKSWRAGSEAVLQREVTEAAAGRFDVDIVQTMAPETESLHREKLLQEVRSPYLKDLIPEASPAHKEWVGFATDLFVAAYNTNKIKKEDLPKTYADLLDPKWKGKLGIEADDDGWFGTLVDALGGEKGLKLMSDIAATNGISPRKGHALLNNLVASGEVPLALDVFVYMPEQLKQKGAPIERFTISPAIAQISTIAMAKKVPNRNSALLFYDFMLSDEGQKLLADTAFIPTSKKVAPPGWYAKDAKTPIKYVDPVKALDMHDKWQKMWEKTITQRGAM
jgi:iron(III) transport system substrate-binding protein